MPDVMLHDDLDHGATIPPPTDLNDEVVFKRPVDNKLNEITDPSLFLKVMILTLQKTLEEVDLPLQKEIAREVVAAIEDSYNLAGSIDALKRTVPHDEQRLLELQAKKAKLEEALLQILEKVKTEVPAVDAEVLAKIFHSRTFPSKSVAETAENFLLSKDYTIYKNSETWFIAEEEKIKKEKGLSEEDKVKKLADLATERSKLRIVHHTALNLFILGHGGGEKELRFLANGKKLEMLKK